MVELTPYLRTDHKAVDKRDPVHTVMGWLTGDTTKVPIVLDDDRPFGILNERALMARSLPHNAHIEQYTLPTRALPESATTKAARDRMAEHRAAYLPVENARGKLAGYVRAIDIAQEIADGQHARDMAVPVTLLREEQTLGEALNAFAREYVDYLPVARADGRVTGVLPRRSVLAVEANVGNRGRKDAGGEKFTILNDPVHGFMDDAPTFLAAQDPFDVVMETLRESGYGIVQDGERVVGVVTPQVLFRPNGR